MSEVILISQTSAYVLSQSEKFSPHFESLGDAEEDPASNDRHLHGDILWDLSPVQYVGEYDPATARLCLCATPVDLIDQFIWGSSFIPTRNST